MKIEVKREAHATISFTHNEMRLFKEWARGQIIIDDNNLSFNDAGTADETLKLLNAMSGEALNPMSER